MELVNRSFITSILSLCFISCAGTPTHLKILEDGGAVYYEESKDPEYNYMLFVRNTRDFGWDGDSRADREKIVQLKFSDKCKSPKILDERPIKESTFRIGKPAVTWAMKIKCDK